MGFESRVKDPRVQVSLNSFGGAVKSAAGAVADEVKGAATAIGHHAASAVKTVAHHAKGATSFSNGDLKHRMQHRTGRAIDD